MDRRRSPATEFVSKGWIGRRGGLQVGHNQMSDRGIASARPRWNHPPKIELILAGGRERWVIDLRSGEPPGTSRGGLNAPRRTMDAAARVRAPLRGPVGSFPRPLEAGDRIRV